MNIRILRSLGPASQADIRNLETAFDASVPSDLRSFWRTNDGAVLECNAVWIAGFAGQTGIDRMIPVREIIAVKERSGLSDMQGMLPIAAAPCGDYFCIFLDEANAAHGSIWFFDHERALTREDLLVVAPDLASLLEVLQPFAEPSGEQQPSPVVLSAWIDPALKG